MQRDASIYADLKVLEVWRYDDRALAIYALQDGVYEVSDRHIALCLTAKPLFVLVR
ncbi:hypothetical protein [Leptodesmis sp.]|uniref:hypothetical protein n=1 Tax=Leptodesmis sp. TaxID=3100501 RepID=UPI00405350B7